MKVVARMLVLFLALSFSLTVLAAPKVLLMVIPDCVYCAQAKSILNRSNISYKTMVAKDGPVPRLYVDGKYQGAGVDAVQTWTSQNKL